MSRSVFNLFGFATTEISNKCSECPPKKLTKTLCEMYRYIVGVRPLALRNKLRALLKPFGRVKGLWRHLSGFRESSALAGLGIRSTAGGVEMGALCSPCRTLASWLGCWGIGIISFLIRERFTPCRSRLRMVRAVFGSVQGYSEGVSRLGRDLRAFGVRTCVFEGDSVGGLVFLVEQTEDVGA